MNQSSLVQTVPPTAPRADLRLCADEMWSFVRHKKGQRWRWWVEDATSGQVVAFVIGRRMIYFSKKQFFHDGLIALFIGLVPK